MNRHYLASEGKIECLKIKLTIWAKIEAMTSTMSMYLADMLSSSALVVFSLRIVFRTSAGQVGKTWKEINGCRLSFRHDWPDFALILEKYWLKALAMASEVWKVLPSWHISVIQAETLFLLKKESSIRHCFLALYYCLYH